jgi:drug/metabolite transporter (DMT)-like permease
LSSIAILIWVINVTLDTVGHVALKFAATADQQASTVLERWKFMLGSLPLWIGIICFCLEFVVWLAFLSVLSLSQGVLLGAINMVSIVIAGRFVFKEKLDRMRLIGMALITVGVIFVGLYA